MHDTQKGGNALLRHTFDRVHADQAPREGVPPFFVFRKHPTEHGARSMQFRGLVVPGFPGLSSTEDLVGIWKSAEGQRFQNYRAISPSSTFRWWSDAGSTTSLAATR